MGPAPKTTSVLQRGSACLPCRKKKMRCDGMRPSCGQCAKSIRPHGCVYEDIKKKSRTQSLKEKVASLEERLRELEPRGCDGIGEEAQVFSFLVEGLPPAWTDGSAWQHEHFSASFSKSFTPALAEELTALSDEGWRTRDPVAYGSPTLLTPSSSREDSRDGIGDSIPWETKYILLDIFLSHHQQLGFHVNIPKFKSSLSIGPDVTTHPALLNAIYLLGCHFSQSTTLLGLSSHFLSSALDFLADSLESQDKLLSIVQASCLISMYFLIQCRLLEAYKHATCAATIVINLGIQKRKVSGLSGAGCISGETELAECLAAFWQTFVLCYTLSGVAGFPPLSMHAMEATDIQKPIIAALIPPVPNTCDDQSFVEADAWSIPSLYSLFLRAKVTALFYRSFLTTSQTMGTASAQGPRSTIEQELDQLLACLPPHPHGTVPSMDVFTVLAMGNAIRINLYKNVPGQRHDRCMHAALGMTFMTELLRNEDYLQMDPVVSACWAIAARLLILLLPEDRTPCSYGYGQGINVLITALRRLGILFPISYHYADAVEKEWMLCMPLSKDIHDIETVLPVSAAFPHPHP